ncbi:putative disease resistance protein RGA3 isoform X2 [Typha angustifolia]|uniref:putative disease resistance protein RGA3 isoform X2 n=1 Tax=Typha angustifolia TaxID=59011 RepID=UPI003C2C2AAD
MAMILDAFVSTCVDRLVALVEERVVMVLGVKDELKTLQEKMEMIKEVLEYAERKRIQDPAINKWLNKLKDVMYDADDIIDICRYEGGKLLEDDQASSSSNRPVCYQFPLLSCFSTIPARHKIGRKIGNLNDRLEKIHKNRLMFTLERTKSDVHHVARVNHRMTSPLLDADVVGMEIETAADELVKRILSMEGNQHQVFAIVGMGGIGKTTLAQKVYNDPAIKKDFSVIAWTCVSKSYKEIKLLKEIINNSKGDYGRAETMAELQQVLRDLVAGKRFFLVLDDVWQSDVWSNLLRVPLQSGEGSGRILITTRDQNVAKGMGAIHIHQVEQLSIDAGWQLLCKRTYLNKEEEVLRLRDVGIQIVEKCGGLPLAIKTVAGLLATKDNNENEWEKILGSHAWSMSELPEELRGALYLSYEDLSPQLKQCFLYFSLYPEDAIIPREDLIRIWVAEGFVKEKGGDQIMEDTAEEYYNELVRRSLLQPDLDYIDGSRCKMHDLLRSLAQYLSKNESFFGDPQLLNPTTLSKIRRLSIIKNGETIIIPPGIETKHLCLKTLLISGGTLARVDKQLFPRLAYLRVLYLNGEGIESIPDSLGDLIHLRMLDLDHTMISKLPDSLGKLTNLQILNLMDCKNLHTLPKGLTQLCNLRRLGIIDTPLCDVPKGLGRLQLLNDLEGFIVANECVSGEMQDGWDLKELESLNQLRWLHIEKLERTIDGVLVLERKHHLRRLLLKCTLQAEQASAQQSYSEEEIDKIEKFFEKLSPPPCLEELNIVGFFGRRYPSCIATSLSRLTSLKLRDCISCSHLPPLGQLPYLRYLKITRALAVVTIGLEFLGNGVRVGLDVATAFPKLEFLIFQQMPNWEDWSLGEEVEKNASIGEKIAPSSSPLLLPRLRCLELTDCPKLRALPEGLKHATVLQDFRINGAHSLRAVENFPSLSQWLVIEESSNIERVTNLPQLRELQVVRSPALSCVQSLDALQTLYVEDESMEYLPEWVSGLLHQRQHLDNNVELELYMLCNLRVLERCQMERQDWRIIQLFSKVRAYTADGSGYLEYTKSPFSYDSNLLEQLRDEEETEEGTEGGSEMEGTEEE